MSMKALMCGLTVLVLSASNAAAHCGSCGVGEGKHDHAPAATETKAPPATKTPAAQIPPVLKEGTYSAKVKALTCAGCGEFIQKAMSEMKGVQFASVDEKNSTVEFIVQKGVTVKTADLQKHLDAWAAKMGMGADYGLSELKSVKKTS